MGLMVGLASPSFARAQIVLGNLFDGSGAAVSEAEILLLGTSLQTRSDSHGVFILPLRRDATHLIRIRKLGFQARTVELTIGSEVDTAFQAIELTRLAVVLPEVVAIARERSFMERISGFADRLATSSAPRSAFWTKEDIARRNPGRVSDLLRRNDMRCGNRAAIFLNGTLLDAESTTDMVQPAELEGMEVYRGPAQIPVQFNVTTAPGRRPGCVILLWTR